jgi:hypothetical protein
MCLSDIESYGTQQVQYTVQVLQQYTWTRQRPLLYWISMEMCVYPSSHPPRMRTTVGPYSKVPSLARRTVFQSRPKVSLPFFWSTQPCTMRRTDFPDRRSCDVFFLPDSGLVRDMRIWRTSIQVDSTWCGAQKIPTETSFWHCTLYTVSDHLN